VPAVGAELSDALRAGMELMPERRIASIDAFARAIGCPLRERRGSSFVRSATEAKGRTSLNGSVARTAAGVFNAAAASIGLVEPGTGELVFRAAWGAGADDIVGVRLAPGVGLAGSVIASGEPLLVADCAQDPRFATQIAVNTGFVPRTMLIVPLKHDHETVGVLSLLDRRDGNAYGGDDVTRAALFAELAVDALVLGGER
jgi:GAF domain-containing protein